MSHSESPNTSWKVSTTLTNLSGVLTVDHKNDARMSPMFRFNDSSLRSIQDHPILWLISRCMVMHSNGIC